MQNQQWIVVTMNDEKWDFNFTLSFFEGTVKDFEKNDDIVDIFDLSNKTEIEGCYLYKKHQTEPVWEDELYFLSDKLETVRFECVYLIPLDKFYEKNFLFCDGVVNRNKKYGFLDLKR